MSSNGRLPAYRDLDDALGLFDSVSTVFNDKRTGRNIQHAMPTLMQAFRLQSGDALAVCSGLQLGQLHATLCSSEENKTLGTS